MSGLKGEGMDSGIYSEKNRKHWEGCKQSMTWLNGLAFRRWKLRGQLRDFVVQVRDYYVGLVDSASSRGDE